jgi:hypothetical protein
LPISNGFDAILVIVDKTTKKAVFVPTKTTLTSKDYADILVAHWIRHFGIPKTVTSDRGSQFVSQFIACFYESCGIKGTPSTAYHPQTDGQTERVNQELEIYLRFYVNSLHDNWHIWLPLAEFSYNDKSHSTTKISPHFATLGLHPWKGDPNALPDARNPAGADFGQQMTKTREHAHAMLKAAQETAKANYDRKRGRSWKFEKGNQVWLESTNITLQNGIKKLAPRRYGPFTIIEQHGPSSFELRLPDAWSKLHPVFNEALLSPYSAPSTPAQAIAHAPPPAIIVDGEPEYDVEYITDHKMMKRKSFYKVHWQGYPTYDDSWEPLAGLEHAQDAVKAFHDAHPSVRRPVSLRFAASDSSPHVVLAIYPENVTHMHDGSKNHEFRKYRLPPDARYLWLYETTPVHGIRTIIEVDSVLLPGQVVGPGRYNAEFNAGAKDAKFAYPIKRLIKLPRVISSSELQTDFAVIPPHRWCPAPFSLFDRFLPHLSRSGRSP